MDELNNKKYHNIETCVFYLLVLCSLYPMLTNPYFITMDGAAHIYNATILKNILFGDDWFGSFYEVNKEFVPNWFGHFALVFFKLFFTGETSDKLFLVCYGILFPLSFRYLVQQISSRNILVSYFIFPFMFTFVFTMGFYNYCFSLVFLFLIVGYYIKHNNSFTTLKNLILSGLFILCYFSHLFSFITSILILWLYLLFNFLKEKNNIKERFILLFKKSFALLFCSIIPLLLTGLYFYNRRDLPKNEVFISISDLTKELYDFRALYSYNTIEEEHFNKVYLVLFSIFSMVILYTASNKIVQQNKGLKYYLLHPSIIWVALCFLFLVIYYKMPDSAGYAGFISVRIAIMIYIFFILFFATSTINKFLQYGLVFVLLGTHFMHMRFKNSVQKDLNKYSVELSIIEKTIPNHSVIYPVDMSGNWLAGHFSNYLSANKQILVLENYEATNDYFPIKWKQKPECDLSIGIMNLNYNGVQQSKLIDYVLFQGTFATFQSTKNDFTLNITLNYKFEMVFENYILFKNKKL